MMKPKIGLALGSGGARGFAHLGVLKVLEENKITIDYLAGSSMGALVAVFYSFGHSMEQLIKISTAFKRKYYLDFTIPKMGFIAGNRVKDLIKTFTHNKNLEDLQIPVQVVATDLIKGEKVVFAQGPIADAVRASLSIPGIFVPEKVNDRLLVDGGVIDRVPISVVKEMGSDIIIGVDVSRVKKDAEITNIYDVIMQSIDILQMEALANHEGASDIFIQPDASHYDSRAFTNIEEIIKIGEEETKKFIPEIRQMIEEWKVNKENET
ncbi:patatin-like phospholipase family protein [Heyndrickxia oleronia]|uniref:Esterase n=1 Tax=Heyndrickxia oleronia TaxID=38875 RepID=A0A8E2I4E7_9BACI|nr:patatin-like phospholipase family protein [Heyndrickxia oleronia]NYV67482.1 patatin-like phospholipase family protein [Bacillus sp. Gen3]OJH17939.1 esterase [Bacillus obstructivus]MBU5210947.1 patatin-like phospholipase family protein [Heyndrickxia oleronia]MCM3453162.1 patatin-like phospholipase family protein [Heyndrickxia oleronia]MEC1376048.1 patatin-like phospholipase family protein [Heyndrickxia oleronia]